MEIKDVIKLVDAGFTRAEIAAMLKMQTAPAEEKPTEEKPAEEAPAAEEKEPELTMNDLLAEIKDLKQQIYKKNIISDTKEPEVKQSAEDILINLLNGKEK